MYSPKIDEALIRPLYFTAKDRRVPMTQLVSELIFEALVARELPDEAARHLDAARFKYDHKPHPQPHKAAA
jgi:hypothetical protein